MPASTSAITHISLAGIAPIRSGKVREIFDLGQTLLMVATDRVSAFDVVMPNGIPDKGKILNQLSALWFNKLRDIIPNHLITINDDEIADALGGCYDETQLGGRCMIVEKCEPVLIESVARAYIAGSLYKEYVTAGGMEKNVALHGIALPPGLLLCGKLPQTIFTPATKAQTGHDENIGFTEAARIAGADVALECRLSTMRLFQSAQAICESAGIILADTKFEFGTCEAGLKLIDEALTPDSSRFWPKETYAPGKNQDSLDKQFIRDYLETLTWDKKAPGPELPKQVVEGTRERYIDIFKRITGADPRL
ncbi:MAG: phosphoribosylaminoimidazolesuccinocarboxamide synthase [Armatimonadetes bacterium]|nr:phosphoribosylaminoimidazolesuccinocarboxamide synthase [Armatimonadota bacterium]